MAHRESEFLDLYLVKDVFNVKFNCTKHVMQYYCRVAVVREQTPGAVHMSGLTFAINIRRNSMPDPAQLVQTAMHGSHYLVILDTLNDEPTIGWARDNRVIARERYHGDELSFYLFLLEIEPVGDYEVMTQYLGVCYGNCICIYMYLLLSVL